MSEIKALEAMLHHYNADQATSLLTELKPVFANEGNFLEKVKEFDNILGNHKAFEPLHEYIFDLMMVHHLANYIEDEEYLDSKEWMDIEDETIERGTEMLNILLYVGESRDSDVTISIDDFLYEFLLVDEDEFQDEHRIYEDLIDNQDLVEESADSVIEISSKINESSELKELFSPLLLFFQDPKSRTIGKDVYNKLTPLERSLLASLQAYQ